MESGVYISYLIIIIPKPQINEKVMDFIVINFAREKHMLLGTLNPLGIFYLDPSF